MNIRDKNVIIVGPSENVLKDCVDIDVDSYDVVVRINGHYEFIPDEYKRILGYRTDFIYHCLNPKLINEESVEFWVKNKSKIITRYQWDERDPSIYFDRYKEFYAVTPGLVDNLKEKIQCNPGTGIVAIYHLLSFPIKTLTVVGFDFYHSMYVGHFDKNGKPRDRNRSCGEDKRIRIMDNQIGDEDGYTHNPMYQLEYIKTLKDKRFIPIGILEKLLTEC